jgi:hypothetical protein
MPEQFIYLPLSGGSSFRVNKLDVIWIETQSVKPDGEQVFIFQFRNGLSKTIYARDQQLQMAIQKKLCSFDNDTPDWHIVQTVDPVPYQKEDHNVQTLPLVNPYVVPYINNQFTM